MKTLSCVVLLNAVLLTCSAGPVAVDEFALDTWTGFAPLGTYVVETDGVQRVHHLMNLQGPVGGALNGKGFVRCRANSEVEFVFEAKGKGGANAVIGLGDASGSKVAGRFLPRFELTPEWKEYRVKTRVPDGRFPTESVSFRFRAYHGAEAWLRNATMAVDPADMEDFEGDCGNLTDRPDDVVTQNIAPGLLRTTATARYRGGRRRVIAFRNNVFRMPQVTKTSTFDSTVRIYSVAEDRRRDQTLNMNFHGREAGFRLEMRQQAERGVIVCSLVESRGTKETSLGRREIKIDSLPADFRVSAGNDGRVRFLAHTIADAAKVELLADSAFFTGNADGFSTELEYLPASDDAEIVIDEYSVGAGLGAELLQPVPFTVENLPEFDPGKAGWDLILQDDFEGERINERIWEIQPHGTGYRADYWPELAFVSNGLLHIRADWNKESNRLCTASIRTHKKYLYGYFEAKMRFTTQSGWWAAFWLYRKNAVTNPFLDGIEYDIFEDYFTRTAKPGGEHKAILDHNLHAGGCGKKHKNWKFNSTLPGSLDDFYVLGCRWTPFEVSYYLNGKLVGSFNAVDNAVSLQPLQPIFSGQIMNPSWQNSDPRGFSFPEDFLVDWIRIYAYPQSDAPKVRIACDATTKEVGLGGKLRFTIDVDKASDGAEIKTVYLFDSGYLLDFKIAAPYEFDVSLDDQYYGATRWASLGGVGKRKPELRDSKHHAYAAFALDEKGRYSASEVIPIDLKDVEER